LHGRYWQMILVIHQANSCNNTFFDATTNNSNQQPHWTLQKTQSRANWHYQSAFYQEFIASVHALY